MKYKLLKDLPWAKAGTIVEADFTRSSNGNISYSFVAEWGRYKGQRVYHGWYPYMYNTFSDWFEEVDERWKPAYGQGCFYLGLCLEVDETVYRPPDAEMFDRGNCFRTRELAEQAAEQIKALLKEFHKNYP